MKLSNESLSGTFPNLTLTQINERSKKPKLERNNYFAHYGVIKTPHKTQSALQARFVL